MTVSAWQLAISTRTWISIPALRRLITEFSEYKHLLAEARSFQWGWSCNWFLTRLCLFGMIPWSGDANAILSKLADTVKENFVFEIQRSLLCTVRGANSTPSFSFSLHAGVSPHRFNDFSSPHWGLFDTALHPVRFKTVILTLIFPNEMRQFRKVFNNLNDSLSKFEG